VRTLDGYLAGLRAYHRLLRGEPVEPDPFAEDWARTFSVVEGGAEVSPGATVHDSVVLAGARIEGGAAVVRSIVCAGATVRAGETLADQVVTPERRAP
jgi:mannose-1-phosphate guanylyltransferase